MYSKDEVWRPHLQSSGVHETDQARINEAILLGTSVMEVTRPYNWCTTLDPRSTLRGGWVRHQVVIAGPPLLEETFFTIEDLQQWKRYPVLMCRIYAVLAAAGFSQTATIRLTGHELRGGRIFFVFIVSVRRLRSLT
jgi:hypothetical protein